MDHFQIVMYLAGGTEFVAGNRTFIQRAGDIGIIDMMRPTLTREMQALDGFTPVVSFVLPRLLLARRSQPSSPVPRSGSCRARPRMARCWGNTCWLCGAAPPN